MRHERCGVWLACNAGFGMEDLLSVFSGAVAECERIHAHIVIREPDPDWLASRAF
ncbi:hypothetical protein [Pandoraea bronchicola]|uniref:Uncharacterized protein n=1 Tax=Pandoraea bronchicola TaxID=2508287 RepID=A0A5E5BW44_9BURK|nr:hypothetical protein [Pandoraea bronchicola]VVE89235.1 hypothetical protein PBR20603_03201 [Pandoraea bronchicola]